MLFSKIQVLDLNPFSSPAFAWCTQRGCGEASCVSCTCLWRSYIFFRM